MENLAHTAIGILLAENAVRLRERQGSVTARARAEIFAVALVGNNLPDLDVTYAGMGGELGYLLQHPGFTHTVPAAIGFALLMLGVVALLRRNKKRPFQAHELRDLALVSALAPLLHIALDYPNNYGVHPFWPLSNRWFYGDFLFIVEPSLWIAIFAPLAASMASRAARWTLWLLLGVGTALLWHPLVPRREAAVLTLIAIALLATARRLTPKKRCLLANAALAFVMIVFVMGAQVTKALARSLEPEGAQTLDVATTPMPANPFCWSVAWVGVEPESRTYMVRIGRSALLPAWLDLAACPPDDAQPTAQLRPLNVHTEHIELRHEYRMPLHELRALAATRCELSALLLFARVPYVTDGVAGDLRYDRKPDLDFSDIRTQETRGAQGQCPRHLPPWRPPRADLLGGE